MRRNEMSPLAESLDLVGVCFDGSGRAHGQAAAPARLRAAGLSAVVSAARLTPDIIVSEPDPGGGPKAGFVNERALLEMVETDLTIAQRAARRRELYACFSRGSAREAITSPLRLRGSTRSSSPRLNAQGKRIQRLQGSTASARS